MKTLIFLFALLVFPALALHAQPQYELQYKSQPQPLKYKFSTYAEGVQEAEGTRVLSERSMQGLVSLRFVAETPQQLTVEMVYDSLKMLSVSEIGETVVQHPPEIIGLRIKKVIARNGDQLSSAELDKFGFLPAAVSFSTQNEFLTNLPDRPVFLSQTVKTTDTDTVYILTSAGLNEMAIEYKLTGEEVIDGYKCVKLAVNGQAELSGDFVREGTQFFLTGQGVITGTILFSPEKGLLVFSENQTKLHLNVMTSGDEAVFIPVIQTSRSEIELFYEN